MAEKLNKIERICKQFDVCFPIKQFDWQDIFNNNMLYDDQESIMSSTVNNDLRIKYPIKVSYQVAFLKQFIAELERRKLDILDCVYEALGRLMVLNDQENCYKHYTVKQFGTTTTITLKENPNYISEGTTGLCSWQASIMLSEHLICSGYDMDLSDTVLELGSGNGLVGLSILKYCKVKKIILSDCHSSVLNQLIKNIKMNITDNPLKLEENLRTEGTTKLFSLQENDISPIIEVYRLPWEEITKSIVKSLNVTCIIAADVVYDSSLFKDLINTVYLFLKYSQNCKYFKLACTVRNVDTLNTFLNMLINQGLRYEELHQEKLPFYSHYIWTHETPIRFLKITLNT